MERTKGIAAVAGLMRRASLGVALLAGITAAGLFGLMPDGLGPQSMIPLLFGAPSLALLLAGAGDKQPGIREGSGVVIERVLVLAVFGPFLALPIMVAGMALADSFQGMVVGVNPEAVAQVFAGAAQFAAIAAYFACKGIRPIRVAADGTDADYDPARWD